MFSIRNSERVNKGQYPNIKSAVCISNKIRPHPMDSLNDKYAPDSLEKPQTSIRYSLSLVKVPLCQRAGTRSTTEDAAIEHKGMTCQAHGRTLKRHRNKFGWEKWILKLSCLFLGSRLCPCRKGKSLPTSVGQVLTACPPDGNSTIFTYYESD